MREGEKAKLLIPSYLAYWNQTRQGLPPYSVLKFDVELVKVRTEDEALRVFATDSLGIDPSRLEAVSGAPGTYYVKLQGRYWCCNSERTTGHNQISGSSDQWTELFRRWFYG